jgi:carbon monoxide dehydrogenase subunit G
MKTLAIIAALAAVSIAAFLAYAATKPDSFRVERATSINAPPEKVFALINDLHAWEAWSPWEKKDPAMKRTFSGPASGKGAAYAWEGNSNVGKGRMQIAEAPPPAKVMLNLDFVRPMEAHNIVEFDLAPRGETTDVRWAMHGPTPYLGKIMHTIFDMDKMVGGDFEAGLAALKAAAEKRG